MKITKKDVKVPADVPEKSKNEYIKNYLKITKESGNLMLFAGDQKVEHLNDDFYGSGIHIDNADPEHMFKIASKSKIGVFAAQLGLIARYKKNYSKVPYLIKINSKSNIIPKEIKDPLSFSWYDIEQIIEFKKNSKLNILGIGYTIYLGSEEETLQLREAAQIIYEAHQYGLIVVLWIYPRGKNVKDEKCSSIIAGATGTAVCLGADFVKVNPPKEDKKTQNPFKEAILAAGRTKVVCAGGKSTDVKNFLKTLYNQIHISGVSGNATGRNIHQKSLNEAIRMCNAVYAITIENKTVEEAYKIYQKK
jgi:fructose-bisphosphate aldolase / 6-deoxy-5-ketofructose 1-phosphate synthase